MNLISMCSRLNSIIILATAPRTCSTENEINNLAGNHNSNWNGTHVKPVDFTADSQSCWTFCWETYSTSYFTWATYDHVIPTWRSGCFCKKGYINPRVEVGYVSGIVCPLSSSAVTTGASTTIAIATTATTSQGRKTLTEVCVKGMSK